MFQGKSCEEVIIALPDLMQQALTFCAKLVALILYQIFQSVPDRIPNIPTSLCLLFSLPLSLSVRVSVYVRHSLYLSLARRV